MAEPRITVSKPKSRPGRTLLRTLLICTIGVVVTHTAWDWQAERALKSRLEQIERMNPMDFRPTEYCDPREDRGHDLLPAAAILDDVGPENETLNFLPTTMPTNPNAWPHLSQAREWYEPTLRRLERAQAKRGATFTYDFGSPVVD